MDMRKEDADVRAHPTLHGIGDNVYFPDLGHIENVILANRSSTNFLRTKLDLKSSFQCDSR